MHATQNPHYTRFVQVSLTHLQYLTVNGVVHADEVQAVRGLLVVRVPAVQEDSNVVVPVEKDQRLLAQNHEDSIA